VVKELIQDDASPVFVQNELLQLAEETEKRKQVMAGYGEIYKALDTGSASANTAKSMVEFLNQQKN
jgi:lipid A disaccharide synthetase